MTKKQNKALTKFRLLQIQKYRNAFLRSELEMSQSMIDRKMNKGSLIEMERCKVMFEYRAVRELKFRWWT